MKHNICLLFIAVMFYSCVPVPTETLYYDIESPDGNLRVGISIDSTINMAFADSTRQIADVRNAYMKLSDGRLFGMTDSTMSGMLPLKKVKSFSVDRVINAPFNRNSTTLEAYNGADFTFNGYGLRVRVYNDGFAYRFYSKVPGRYQVADENVDIMVHDADTAYFAYSNASRGMEYQCSFENRYYAGPLSEALKDTAIMTPALVRSGGRNIIISDNDISAYPGMFLKYDGKSLKGAFARIPEKVKKIPPRSQEIPVGYSDVMASCNGSREFPWRVIGYGDDKSLLSSDLMYVLGNKGKIRKTDWIKPGKAAWEWWNAIGLDSVDFMPGINTETYEYFIDFAAEFGIEYIVIDEGWYPSDSKNIFKTVPGMNLKRVVDYGREKGVGVILWTVAYLLDKDLELACKYYSSLGVKGFKVDFIDRDDAEAVRMVERICAKAAEYGLILDLHGMYKPAGLNRKYPNVLNFEGVWGLEQMKWSNDDMISNDLTFPFIRMWAGPVDYTQGAMRNKTREEFIADYENPSSQGTRARQVAEYVVFDSPLAMLCDSPSEYYADSLCTRFIADLPVTYDKVYPMDARIGKLIVTARKKGNAWFIGGINGWEALSYDLQLDKIISPGETYSAVILKDAEDSAMNPQEYVIEEFDADAYTSVDIEMAPGGGFALMMYPESE